MTGFTFSSLFSGAGGDITGMTEAGGQLLSAANHWDRAIETIDSNYGHTGAEMLCIDINQYDMRNLPKAQVLWASVICTEMSPAGGSRKLRGQQSLALEELGHVPAAAYERTRACALDVMRATEVHRYDAVVVENVIEFARDWELFEWWIEGMCRLKPGYDAQILCADSAHMAGPGNAPAPQWRGRIYIVFTRKGIPRPNLELRPTSWCPACDGLVEGVQAWKRPDRPKIGKYGPQGQYVYRCSTPGCSEVVEPLVLPAEVALDLSDLGERIGDRAKPLSKATMARITWGYETFGRPMLATVAGNTFERGSYRCWPADGSPLMARVATGEDALVCPPLVVNVNHDDARVHPADASPLTARTTKIGDLILQPQPWITMARNNGRARGTQVEPLATLATGNHHYVTTPPGAFVVKNFGGNAHPRHLSFNAATSPLGTITTRDHHALVVPYRRGNAKTTAEPLHTLATKPSAALVSIEDEILDARYRMLRPREHAAGQRFPSDYYMAGNIGEQTMLAGNAVSVNAGHHIGRALAEVLA